MPAHRLLLLALLPPLLLLAAFATRPARADCDDCPPPSERELRQQPGFEILDRWGPWGIGKDYVEMDGGECRVVLEDAPVIVKVSSWLALRATGEVWHCPHGSSTDRVVIETRQGDSTTWSVSGSFGLDASLAVASLEASISAGRTRGESITEVTRVEKTISAAWCLRIPWEGYFEIARYEARAPGRVERRWAWWTKNLATGSSVHAHGEMWVTCERGELVLWRRAPIAGIFHLSQRPCQDPACADLTARDLGWFPEPPAPPPVITEPSSPPPPRDPVEDVDHVTLEDPIEEPR